MATAQTIADRPTKHPPDPAPPDLFGAVPQELLRERRWLLWRYESREGKATKVPHLAGPGVRRADVTDPRLWRSSDEALQQLQRFDGLGVALGEDPLTGQTLSGVDLDGVRDPATGELTEAAAQIVQELSSYTEASPSGRGVHVLVRGELPDGAGGGKWALPGGGHVEVYSRARFFTVTGDHLGGTPRTLHDRTSELAALWRSRPAAKPAEAHPPGPPPPGLTLADEEVLQLAFGAANGATVQALWHGEDLGYPSRSEGDAALAHHLAFYASDPAQVERLLLRSARVREKWQARPAWLRAIAEGACRRVKERYSESPPDRPGVVRLPRALLRAGLRDGPLLLAALVVAGVPEGDLPAALGGPSARTLRRWWCELRQKVPEELLRTRPSRRFVLVPEAALLDVTLPRAARVTALHVAALMQRGRAQVGQAHVADRRGRERARVTQDLALLVRRGHLCTSGPAHFCRALGRRAEVNTYWWPLVDTETGREGTAEAREGEGAVTRSTSPETPDAAARGHQEHVSRCTYAGGGEEAVALQESVPPEPSQRWTQTLEEVVMPLPLPSGPRDEVCEVPLREVQALERRVPGLSVPMAARLLRTRTVDEVCELLRPAREEGRSP